MKLRDLDPQWVAFGKARALGLNFACPCRCGARVEVAFVNPLGGGLRLRGVPAYWYREGHDFDELSLSPAIVVDGHWTGRVHDGFVTFDDALTRGSRPSNVKR